ncbi:hypothetical protein EJB05_45920 [Eragrostis curvula]|uniref:Ubiquitin carboxyl-terminal hydrolase n=1 Tax=Eragrostis curvula TaxID=38414 RepID=A0A5J9TLT7_9POAL|nr:hypothetical protein EJB05_45920 [Eragrostis curvula]
MAGVSTAAAPEGVLHRRIEFHLARRPHTALAVGGGGFRMETLNPDAASKAAAVAAGSGEGEARRPEKGDAGGMDPELSVARIYLGRIGAGLQNLGNTCYLNSVLQCLTYTEPFAAYLQSGKHKFSSGGVRFSPSKLSLCLVMDLWSYCWFLCTVCSSESCQDCSSINRQNSDTITNCQELALYPFMLSLLSQMFLPILTLEILVLKSIIGNPFIYLLSYDQNGIFDCKIGISRSFRNSRQEDAHELMVNLLESMHKCCLPSGVPSESQSAYDKSLVHKIFGGRLRSQVKCTRCSHCSNKFDPFLDLSLDIAKATTLVRALQNFTEEELLDGGEKQYQCERCRQKVVAKKRFTIDKAPNVLTIHLKRFSPFNPRHKIDKKVDFQPTLDLKPFVSDSKGSDLKYSLYGVLVHAGWNTQSGHYYCYVRTSSGMWHNLDDNQVRQVREADVLRQKAYMLFYVRDSLGNPMPRQDIITANVPIKKTPEKIPCLNGKTGSDKMDNVNISSIFAKTSVDCSKHDVKTEDAAASLPFAQKALRASSSDQRPSLLLSSSGKQSVAGKFSQELPPKVDMGKVTSVTSPMEAIASNDVMPINECLTSNENVKGLPESPEQANETAKPPVTSKNNIPSELSRVDSGGSVQIVVAGSCNGSMAKMAKLKSKKFVRYPVVNIRLGSRQLLVASLKLGKKTKHKRTGRRSVVCKAMSNIACLDDCINEQLTSTSATAPSGNVQKVAGAGTSATTESADLPKLGPSSSTDQTQSKKNVDAKLGDSRTVSVRARDLMEATVPSWDDIHAPSTKTAGPQHSKRSIGYVLDEWDEEYDRGKTKKVRQSKDDFDGSNPFQEEANYISQRQMKQKSLQGKSWNKPNSCKGLHSEIKWDNVAISRAVLTLSFVVP